MKKFNFLIIISFVFLGIGFSHNENDVVSVKFLNSEKKLIRWNKNLISIEIHISEPYHIYSNQPTDNYMVATSIEFEAQEGIVFGKPEFPAAKLKTFGFSETPLAIFDDTFIVNSSVTLLSSFKEPEVKISGSIRYQTCDENLCLAPAELYFIQNFQVADSKETIISGDQSITPIQKVENEKMSAASREEDYFQTFREKGLFLMFVLVFLGGLALNLTPCIYPLIPITISYFGGQAQGRKGGVFVHAMIYVFGMALTYSTLGLIAALTGSLFGAALQNPVVLLGIACILIILALSMFDLCEFRLPSFMTKFSGRSKQGHFGTLLMGLTVGIVAAPCIGPFVLGLLTYVGKKGNPLLGFFLFFVLAIGLGFPFLFLAVFSGSIDKLPKSGSWMIWVRTIFGFVLIAMAVYFLKTLLPNFLFYHLTMTLILFISGVYIAWIEPTKLGNKVFPIIRNIVGIIFFLATLIFAVNGIKAYIDESMEKVKLETCVIGGKIHWFAYSAEKIKEAEKVTKPIMIDFYADWCIPCKKLDNIIYFDKKVVEQSRNFVMLKVNLTVSNNLTNEKLKKEYQIRGMPTLVFLRPNGTEIKKLRVVGFIKADKLLDRMRQAANNKC